MLAANPVFTNDLKVFPICLETSANPIAPLVTSSIIG